MVVVLFNGNDVRDTYFGQDKYLIVDGVAVTDVAAIKRRVPVEYNAHYAAIPNTFTRFEILSHQLELLGLLRNACSKLGRLRSMARTAAGSPLNG